MLNKIKKFVSMAMVSCCLLALCSCSESITKDYDGIYELHVARINGSYVYPTTDDTSKLTIKNGKISYSITDGNLTGEYKISESDIDKSNESLVVITVNDNNNEFSCIDIIKKTDEISLIVLEKDINNFYTFTEDNDALTENAKNDSDSTSSSSDTSSSSSTSTSGSFKENLPTAMEDAAQLWLRSEFGWSTDYTVYHLEVSSYDLPGWNIKGTFFTKDGYGQLKHKYTFDADFKQFTNNVPSSYGTKNINFRAEEVY